MLTEECPVCGKKFVGTTQRQVTFYKNQHMLARHPERVEVVEKGVKNE